MPAGGNGGMNSCRLSGGVDSGVVVGNDCYRTSPDCGRTFVAEVLWVCAFNYA